VVERVERVEEVEEVERVWGADFLPPLTLFNNQSVLWRWV